MTTFADLGSLSEAGRIDVIAGTLALGKTVAVLVDADPGKADRYLAKIRAKCPGVEVQLRTKGPVKGCVTLKLGLPVKQN